MAVRSGPLLFFEEEAAAEAVGPLPLALSMAARSAAACQPFASVTIVFEWSLVYLLSLDHIKIIFA